MTSSTCVSIDNSGVLLEQELLIADSCHDNTRHRSLSVREWDVGKEGKNMASVAMPVLYWNAVSCPHCH